MYPQMQNTKVARKIVKNACILYNKIDSNIVYLRSTEFKYQINAFI